MKEQAEAERLAGDCNSKAAAVTSVVQTKKTEKAPALYDLTTLQRDANRLLGYTAQQTLDYLQSLYEKKLSTYPRTDSRYLTDDMEGGVNALALCCAGVCGTEPPAAVCSGQVCSSKKVSDHHAVVPTMAAGETDLEALPAGEREILRLAARQVLMAVSAPFVYLETEARLDCGGNALSAKGKTILHMGWRAYTEKGKQDNTLPELSEGQNFPNPAAKVTEHTTTPPKPHSEASLLSAMERAGNGDTDPDAERRGLGTPATRAAVIEKLVKGGFAERKGKQLIPTQNGAALISVLPDMLTSPQLTAEWENNLTQIAKGAADPGEFLSGIEAMARELVQTHAAALDGKKDLFREEKPSVGKCPRCGSPVHEGKKNYYCSNKECAFVMWKNDRFFEERKTAFSAKIAAALLKSGKVNVKKLYSPKTGKTYDGTIVLADTGGKYVNYRIEVQKN